MSTRNQTLEKQLSPLLSSIVDLAYSARNDLLIKVYWHFKDNNYPTSKLPKVAGMTRQRLYQIVSANTTGGIENDEN